MTDFTQTQPIKLSDAEYLNILALGKIAKASIAAAGGGPPPVGVWQGMYAYISSLIDPSSSGFSLLAPVAQQYWFEQAPFINGDKENVPSGYFVRDVTAVGFGVAGPTDPTVQAVSNTIGLAIYNGIVRSVALPAFWQQLNDDIYSALSGGTTPYPYPALPLPGWGGTFYYWNAPYDPNGSINETTAPLTSVSQYVLGNSTANQTFITNYSQATANTLIHFASTIPSLTQLIPAIWSGLQGINNIWNSGLQGKLDVVKLIGQTIVDFGAQGGSEAALQNALFNFVQSQLGLYLGSGSTTLNAGGVANAFLVGGQGSGATGNDTLTGWGDPDTFLINLPTGGSSTQTINDPTGLGQIVVSTGGQFTTLGGSSSEPLTAVAGQQNAWQDTGGTEYVYNSLNNQLLISGGYLGSGNEIVVNNFNFAIASGTNPNSGLAGGFAGIFLPETISISAGATNGSLGNSDANFAAGGTQSYTLLLSAPSTSAETVTVTLSGAIPSDFEAIVGDTIEQVNSNGTFAVTLEQGATSVIFSLSDATSDNGLDDIANGANLTLTASLPNPQTLAGGLIETPSLSVTYVPAIPNTAPAPKPSDVITGIYNSGTGVTSYNGDGGDDYITGTGASNLINAQNSGNDSIVAGGQTNTINGGSGNSIITVTGTANTINLGSGFNTVSGGSGHDIIDEGGGDNLISANNATDVIVLGGGNNQIYAGAQASLSNAIISGSSGGGTGVQGDLIAVGDGNNTIVGGKGNDLINVGSGNDVIVMGPGNDSFAGGFETTQAVVNWTTSISGSLMTGEGIAEIGVSGYAENYVDPYPQPLNGNNFGGPGNDTIYGGSGNEVVELANGNNYVETGNGNDSTFGGMGNDTIVVGSGLDTVRGGGGTTYIEGGSGTDLIYGGDGNNTIIGGSGNSTLVAANGPLGTLQYAGANLEQNYVFGGSGNDVIEGSAGQDTLIAGTGNTTITGISGSENITGGSGNDLLNGGTGNNTINAGGAGLDSLYAFGSSSSTSILYGGDGTDLISGGSGANTLVAGDGGTADSPTTVTASQTDVNSTTTIDGGAGVDFLEGGVGTSVIYGGAGGTSQAPTSILAYTGNTTVYGGLGTDVIEGGSGTDVLYAGDGGTALAPTTVSSGSGVSTLIGGAGPSILQDTVSGSDLIESGTANDTLVGMGADTLVAGTGNDLLQTNGGAIDVQINAGYGNDSVVANGGTVNLLLGTGILDTDLTASAAFDTEGGLDLLLSGDGGSIEIQNAFTGALASVAYADPSSIPLPTFLKDVFGGDQTISLNGNRDLILNLGSNEAVGNVTDNGDTVSSWGNDDTIVGGYSRIYSTGNSDLISSGEYDNVVATGNADTFVGGIGGDQVSMGGANSLVDIESAANGNVSGSYVTLSGANDTAMAGIGTASSTIVITNASDILQVAPTAGPVVLEASVTYTAPSNVTSLTLIGTNSISATGNASNDTLAAGAGVDTLVSGSGIDTLIGGTGSTTFVVNNANDVVQDTSTTTNNVIQSSVSYSLIANVNTLTLTGTTALTGTANNANDTLNSNSGVDTLIGGSGNDTFILNNPMDVVQDTLGSATIVYTGSASFTLPSNVNTLTLAGTSAIEVTGNSGNDSITGNSGADTLVAGSGVDTLVSGTSAAAQSLIGGTGNDLFVINNSSDIVTVGNTHGIDTIQSSVNYTEPANVSSLVLVGTAALTATGNATADLITANAGSDTLTAGSGVATLVGGIGNDTFIVNSVGDVVSDTNSTAINTLEASVNYVLPSNVNVFVAMGTSALIVTANGANDSLNSNSGNDTLIGGAGNETFVINSSGVVLQDTSVTAVNAAYASVSYSLPTDVNLLTLTGAAALKGTGNSANDVLTANLGADTLIAGSGADTLVSGVGASPNSLVGGTGNDVFIVNAASDIVTVGATHGADTIRSSTSYTLPTNVSTLVLTGSANLVGTAVSGNNTVVGNAGNDTLRAGTGNDMLVAGTGIDTLIGGAGTDTFVIDNAADVLQSLGSSGNTVMSSVSYSMAANVTSLVLEGTANLVGTGNGSANSLFANSGNDTLIAGSGATSFVNGQGNDLFIVNSSSDQVVPPSSGIYGIDTIQSSASYALSAYNNILVLSGSGNLTGTANNSADVLIGNAGSDTLTAGIGNDTLIAGTGLTKLVGGSGNNTFVVNNSGDTIQETVAGHNNVLLSSVSYTLPTNVNTLTLTGSGNLIATANSGNDSIRGNSGADVLNAGAGLDTLAAGSGLATLVGGAGSDTFIVNSTADFIESASTSGNVAMSSATYVLPTNVNVLTLTGISNISATGNSASDTLIAGAGQDTLTAGSGVATLLGGTGNDTFVVNSTSDVVQDNSVTTNNAVQSSVNYTLGTNVNSLVLSGTAALKGAANGASDTLTSNSGLDTLLGGSGNDSFVINNVADIIQDTATGAANTALASVNYSLATNVNTLMLTGSQALLGTANGGIDTLSSNSGVDTLVGGAGNDTFIVGNALDVVQDSFTATTNLIVASVSYTLPTHVNLLTLTGSAALGATGNGAMDIITANAGTDTLTAGSGVATLIGGSGNDTFVVNSTSDVVVDTSSLASNNVISGVSFSLGANVNSLSLTGTLALIGTANSGNDTLVSNSGIDTLVGGSGSDIFVINNAADVIENGNASDTIESSVNYTLPSAINSLVLTGTANISATGNGNIDVLAAGGGFDTLTAGSAYTSTLIGGTANDTFVVNSNYDVVVDSSTTTSNQIVSSVNYSLPVNVDALTLTGSANLQAYGNSDSSNVLTANVGNDQLFGMALSNTLYGGVGSDSLYAGAGENLIYAGNGGILSRPSYVYGNSTAANPTTQTTIYGGSGVDILEGGPGSDLIYAGIGTDSLFGGIGADTLVGGTGSDALNNTVSGQSGTTYEFVAGFGQETIGNLSGSGLNAGSSSDTIAFGTGIEVGALTATALAAGAQPGDLAPCLLINDGAGSILIPNGFAPGTIAAITFSDTGPEPLKQLMNTDGPGTETIVDQEFGQDLLSTGNAKTVLEPAQVGYVWAFGDNDIIDTTAPSSYGTTYVYGNNSTVNGGFVWAGGSQDSIESFVSATLAGSNDTLLAARGSDSISIYQSSDVVEYGAGVNNDSIDTTINYTLPTAAVQLTLDSSVGGLSGLSNATGGTLVANGNFDTLTGGAGSDTLIAAGANDVLVGGTGHETYILQNASDSIQFGSGVASLTSIQTAFSYSLTGAANNLTLTSNAATGVANNGNDSLTALGNSDILVGGSGNDTLSDNSNYGALLSNPATTMVGGAGNDTFVVNNPSDLVIDNDASASNSLYFSANGTLSANSFLLPLNVNTLVLGGEGAVLGIANSASDSLVATGSDDTLVAGTGNDTLVDASYSGDAFVFNAGFGQDQIMGAVHGDIIDFGPGIAETSLSFTAVAGTGSAAPSLVITGAGGSITVQGGAASGAIGGIDFSGGSNYSVGSLLAPSGRATVAGTHGNLILSTTNDDVVTGGSGQDTIDAWGSGDTLNAGAGGSVIYAGGVGDSVLGGAATDLLEAIGSQETLVGGTGTETFVVTNASATIEASASGHNSVVSSVSFTLPNNVTTMTMSGTLPLSATGNSSNDVITGNSADDTLIAGTGIDSLVGGSQADTFVIDNAADTITPAIGSNDTIQSLLPNYTLPVGINNLSLSAGESGTGNSANDYIIAGGNGIATAGTGNDTLLVSTVASNEELVGGAGNDLLIDNGISGGTIISGTGVDTLESSDQADYLYVNNSADVVAGLASADTLYTSVSYTLTTSQPPQSGGISWVLTGTGNLVASDQSAGNVIFHDNSGNDTLVGGFSSNNFVLDGGGIATEIGGPADNTFNVNNASDVVIASPGSVNTLTSTVSYSLPTNVNFLQLDGANLIGTANNGSDTLLSAGASSLVGGTGNDSLVSNSGQSTLIAGTGNDTLVPYDSFSASSNDWLVLNPAFGTDLVNPIDPNSLGAVIDLGAGISASNLTITAGKDPLGATALKMSDGSSSLTLDQVSNTDTYQFSFAGSAPITLSQLLTEVTVTTSSAVGAFGNIDLEGSAAASIAGGAGHDTLYAGALNDTLVGGTGSQNLNALANNDVIVDGIGGGILSAYGSNDTLVGGSGADELMGPLGGNTVYVVNSASDTVIGQSTALTDTVESSIGYTLPGYLGTLLFTGTAALVGTGANFGSDTLVANAGADTLIGNGAADTFIVNNSADKIQESYSSLGNKIVASFGYSLPTNINQLVLTGTAALIGVANNAADTLTSNVGADTLTGGSGSDTFVVNNASDVIQDTSTSATNVAQSTVSFTLPINVNRLVLTGTANLVGTGNNAADSLVGGSGFDTLVAGSATDTLVAGLGLTTLEGGAGNDVFVVNNSNDIIQDTVASAVNTVQSSANYTLVTNVNSLILTGTAALVGAANGANDTLTSNSGLDTLVGGAGNDTFVISNSDDSIQDTFATASNSAKSSVSYSLAANVNTLTLTGSANLVGTANSGNDSLTGNSGTDSLLGGAGIDTLVAGTGVDTLVAGSGATTFVINSASDAVVDAYAVAGNTLRSSVTYVLPTNINVLVLTGSSALKGTANSGADTLTSNSGVDTLVGSTGNDVFVVANASDIVQDTSTTANNLIDSTVAFSLPTDVNTLVFTGSTALHGSGNAGSDSLVANTGADTLSAGNGSDTLVSSTTGTAVDSLVGGTGTDLFVVNYSGDIVTVGTSHGADTIQSSASYTDATNVSNLVLTGTGNLSGTGTTTASELVANSGADTLTAGTAATTLIGGSGNDTFVVNSASDVVEDGSITASNILSSSVTYTLPTNVNRLILTGSAAAVGTANSGNDTLTANSGSDTLVSANGSAIDSLVGGTGADLFVVNNASDIVTVGSSHGVDTIQSSVSYSASTNVANLTLTGTSALAGIGNSLAGILTANSGADTLTAGTGADTLVGSTIGTDTFVVNSASDIVTEATSGTSDSIQSSASTYTLPTNVQYLVLTGSAALAGTGNSATSLLIGNTGNDTLTGGTGIAALEGGRTAGSDQIKAVSNQAALIAGGGSSTLTGGTYKDFYAAGKVSDSITTGATANVVSVNKNDGATTLQPTSGATNVLSLGAGIDTESLYFTKTGNNLILTDGVSGDSITFANWYVGTADQNYTKLQVVEIASANYNSGGSDALRNKPLEEFNFTSLVAAYNTAGSPANWALSTAMPSASLASSATADYGGDLAYYFGLNGNLTGVDLSDVSATLTNTSYGTATQTINAFSSISGGTGLHLLITQPTTAVTQPLAVPQPPTEAAATAAVIPVVTPTPSPAISGTTEATIKTLESNPIALMLSPHLPQVRTVAPDPTVPEFFTARRGLSHPVRTTSYETSVVSAAAIQAAIAGKHDSPEIRLPERGAARSYVDPINLRWITLHAALDQTNDLALGGAETAAVHDSIAGDALVGGGSRLSRTKHLTDPGLGLPLNRERFL